MATKLLVILKRAKIITIRPALLKNIPALELLLMLRELKLTRASTGKDPRANASMVRPPFKKLPVESV